METKFIRSKWMAKALGFGESAPAIAASVVTIVDGNSDTVHALLAACDELGLKYQSSHSNVVEDNGLFPDVTAIVEHKSRSIPTIWSIVGVCDRRVNTLNPTVQMRRVSPF